MKWPRTIFGPFAVVSVIGVAFALSGVHEVVPVGPAPEAAATQQPILARNPLQIRRARLLVPVRGVTRDDLHDTWGDARSQGRTHEGIDIMAPQGAEVLAAADGRIVKFFDSARGGITIYQFDAEERFVYYYAHLSARAPNLAEGDQVRQGAVIGYVGSSGNATTPHLHFELQRLGPAHNWWQADAVNPYPYLVSGSPPA